jgi:DNA adenine methylase
MVKLKPMIKSPLRYPGGKSKALPQIIQYLPLQFSEYREPFVGGGSLFIYLQQIDPQLKIWINDLNQDLASFWHISQSNLENLVAEVRSLKASTADGKLLFQALVQASPLSDFDRAVRFFVLNRITFSGTVDCGGYSQQAFQRRFTDSSINRLSQLGAVLEKVRITNFDYGEVIDAPGEDVFIFLDPPYLAATASRLYGKRGDLHVTFDHQQFAERLKQCSHQWLVTYDDSPEIRENFSFAHIYDWELQYGMNNYRQQSAAKGKELLITNYEINAVDTSPQQLQLTLDVN